MPKFVDRVVLHATAGAGGNGCASVHREKYKPLGGPDGGNGGRGGSVVLVVDPGVHTLLDFHHRPHATARNGKQGQGAFKAGANADDLELAVPDGTVVLTEAGEMLADLVGPGTRFVAAEGGRGGLGNAALASTARKAPGFALLGEPGEARDLVIELRSIADVGLVGFPSAGKSSLVAALSAARPKIADYPFTTLVPQLGVVTAGEEIFTVADVPGLIPGASDGRGLGLDFLRHVERCAVLVHVLDCAAPEMSGDPDRNPVADFDVIEAELAAYEDVTGADLRGRPRIVALNKVDLPAARAVADRAAQVFAQRGLTVCQVSAATREGLRELAFAIAAVVAEVRSAAPAAEPTRRIIRPQPTSGPEFEIEQTGPNAFLVRGAKPWRWVQQTDFANEEAVGYLADRLARLGVEDALAKAGAEPGAPVRIGAHEFDWQPTVYAGEEFVPGNRGTDYRFDDSERVSAAERKAARAARRRPYEEETETAE